MNKQINVADIKNGRSFDVTKSAKQVGIGTVEEFFNSRRNDIIKVLPKHVPMQRMLGLALNIINENELLATCNLNTLFGAMVQLTQIGLEPNTPLGQAYIIPFKNKQKNRTDAQIIIGYKGLIDLARRSGNIVNISAHEVCENDYFEFAYGLDEKLEHKPVLTNRGPIIAFYAVAKLDGGGFAFEVMSDEQVNVIRDQSANYRFAKDKSKTIWGEYYAEMGRKTVLRKLFKYLPMSAELAKATELDEAYEADRQDLDLDNIIDGSAIIKERQKQDTYDSNHQEVYQGNAQPADKPKQTNPADINSQTELNKGQGSAQEKPTYSDKEFETLFPAWKAHIEKGRSVDELISKVLANRSLSDKQLEQLKSLNTADIPF